MGKKEADADGIEYYFDANRGARGRLGATVYKVKCSMCGEEMESLNYGRDLKYVCKRCKKNAGHIKKMIEDSWFNEIEEKGEHRFNRALDQIQSQVNDFSIYEKAIAGARKAQDRYGSVPEAMVAVELLRLRLPFVPQQKIGKYRVDFYIPKIKMIIEVDGKIFHQNRFGGEREARIQFAMGLETKILHIPAELIEKDIQKLGKLIEAKMKMP